MAFSSVWSSTWRAHQRQQNALSYHNSPLHIAERMQYSKRCSKVVRVEPALSSNHGDVVKGGAIAGCCLIMRSERDFTAWTQPSKMKSDRFWRIPLKKSSNRSF